MKGAASRVSALLIAVCSVTSIALADGSDVSDRDRVWVNFTREAAVVGEKHFWIELRGIKLMNDQGISQPDNQGMKFDGPTLGLNGYPVNQPRCSMTSPTNCIESIDGGRFDLVGAYGLGPSMEVGVDFPFIMQQQISFTDGTNQEDAEPGDLLLYGKFKRQIAEHWAGALGLEVSAPTGSPSKFLGSGHTGLNPFLSARYQSGRLGVGAHAGFLLNVDGPADVFNWSVETILRGNQMFALRCEVNGRVFRDGETFNDISVWPGIDFNLTDNIIIRPQGLAHCTSDAINWGIGVGLVFTM
jgi:hypothetical protein